MYIKRSFNLALIYFFTWRILLSSFLLSLLALVCYDVMDMLGETNLPEKVQPIHDVRLWPTSGIY